MFVPNNQVSAQDTQPVVPVQAQIPVEQTPAVQPIPAPTPAQPGALEKFFAGLAKFIAKITGQPDPIT